MRWFSKLPGDPKTVAGKHIVNYARVMQINPKGFVLQLHRLCLGNALLSYRVAASFAPERRRRHTIRIRVARPCDRGRNDDGCQQKNQQLMQN
jgi:hypothetical protein